MPKSEGELGRKGRSRACLRRLFAISLVLASAPGVSFAAAFDDPDWPCIQRRVPELSIGQMWSGPPPAPDFASDADLQVLARRLAPRRVSVEDIAAAAEQAMRSEEPASRSEWLASLFASLLDRINAERAEIIAGIGRYAARQRALSGEIDTMQLDEELQDHLAWETRIYKDRAQSLTYVCETPVLLERRAFAIGRALEGLM